MELNQKLDYLASLLEYPTHKLDFSSMMTGSFLQDIPEEAKTCMESYFSSSSEMSLDVQQELFVRTFDQNPDCALEIGWHLFGEDYKRGEMMAFLRGELREAGLVEGSELSDYLGNVLRLLGKWNHEDAAEFFRLFLNPALSKLTTALSKSGTHYLSLFKAINEVCSTELIAQERDHEIGELEVAK